MVPDPPGAPQGDLFDQLLERRIVVVTGSLGHEAATLATARLMLLDATGDGPIELRLSCPDGDLDAATALAGTIDLLGVPVRALGSGEVGGPAVAALVAAGRRFAHPHCVFLLKDPTFDFQGRTEEIVALAAAHQRQLDGLHLRLAETTGQPLDRVVADMRRGVVLDAAEALAYGLVQGLAAPRRGDRPAR